MTQTDLDQMGSNIVGPSCSNWVRPKRNGVKPPDGMGASNHSAPQLAADAQMKWQRNGAWRVFSSTATKVHWSAEAPMHMSAFEHNISIITKKSLWVHSTLMSTLLVLPRSDTIPAASTPFLTQH